jgi:opacity protein-like surface antigen
MEKPMRRLVAASSVLALFCGVAPSASQAEAAVDYSRPGVYIGVSGLGAIAMFDDPNEALDVKDSWGLGARAGYRVGRYFAAEVQYEWIEGVDVESNLGPTNSLVAHFLTVNARAILPLEGRAQIYLSTGMGMGIYSSRGRVDNLPINGTQTDFTLRFAAGADYYLTDHVVFNAEVGTVYTSDEAFGEPFPLTIVSAGLQYRF